MPNDVLLRNALAAIRRAVPDSDVTLTINEYIRQVFVQGHLIHHNREFATLISQLRAFIPDEVWMRLVECEMYVLPGKFASAFSSIEDGKKSIFIFSGMLDLIYYFATMSHVIEFLREDWVARYPEKDAPPLSINSVQIWRCIYHLWVIAFMQKENHFQT